MGIRAIIRRRKRKKIRKRQRATRKAAGKAHIEDQLRKTFPKLVVANGPFRGMIYPEPKSVGSVLFSKLLGSYESELGEILQEALETDYSEIVDIGCAEGRPTIMEWISIRSRQIAGGNG